MQTKSPIATRHRQAKFAKRTTSTDQITSEDRRAVAAVLKAVAASNFAGGATARDYEAAISDFQRIVLHLVPRS